MTTKTLSIYRAGNPFTSLGTAPMSDFKSGGNAEPTSRIPSGSEVPFDEEWMEPGHLADGRSVSLVYHFDAEQTTSDEAENYPWDDAAVSFVLSNDEE